MDNKSIQHNADSSDDDQRDCSFLHVVIVPVAVSCMYKVSSSYRLAFVNTRKRPIMWLKVDRNSYKHLLIVLKTKCNTKIIARMVGL